MRFKLSLLLGICLLTLSDSVSSADKQPNVLFIAVDDLRPELNCYGREHIRSPNIDRLAAEGVLFERAYCMVPTCGASRASLMTGVRPSRNRFKSYLTRADRDAPDAVPLHTHFKNSGYQTMSLGKVFHHKDDHVDGWSIPPWKSNKNAYQDLGAMRAHIAEGRELFPKKKRHRGAPFESFDAPDNNYPDGHCADEAIGHLKRLATEQGEKPFFLAVGFLKPHLPFNAPKKYWDMYDRDSIKLPNNYRIPTDVPKDAPHSSGELRSYALIHPKKPVDRETALSLIHGYYACVSFADAQIGRVLETLKDTGLDKNTIVVLWGDHGWQLGEHGMWNKHSCFETSLHTPLIMKAPTDSTIKPATRVSSLVEFIDIYPTLCELCEVPLPGHLDGTSQMKSMRDPTLPGNPFAISRFKNGNSIHDGKLRYSEYVGRRGKRIGAMMFDHSQDPTEDHNVYSPDNDSAKKLSKTLRSNMGRD
ncbi:MAG: sulfatase [Planctomycetaceae bacterium]